MLATERKFTLMTVPCACAEPRPRIAKSRAGTWYCVGCGGLRGSSVHAATLPPTIAENVTGTLLREGMVKLRWNSKVTRLDAPGNRKWLPCSSCEAVGAVAIDLVSWLCERCEVEIEKECGPFTPIYTSCPVEYDADGTRTVRHAGMSRGQRVREVLVPDANRSWQIARYQSGGTYLVLESKDEWIELLKLGLAMEEPR